MNDFIFNAESKERVLARLNAFLSAWPSDKPCQITVTRFVKSRSVQQNRALFGHAYKILRGETGHELEELHDFFCRRYFGVAEYELFGEVRTRPLRTTTTNEQGKRDVLSWDEFQEFFKAVQQFAASELMVNIPDPDKEYWRRKEAA